MYGQVAGAGAAAGVPAALAFTGVTTQGLALTLGIAGMLIVMGVAMLRRSYQRR